MKKIILYHGSSKKIEIPKYGEGKEYNDYGRGFYCTEHLELAKEWACTELSDGYANRYELDLSGLHIAKLIGRVCGAKRPHSVFEQPIYTMSM